ncbi:MAG: hypothetical protein PVF58_03785 [Candidatus Methanofastidiosia archaeon]
MLQNEEELRSLVYEVQQNGGIDSNIAARIDGYLVSIDRKIQRADYLYELVEKADFSRFYTFEEINDKKEEIEHFIELDGVSLHFSNREYHDSLINIFFENFLSNLVAASNIFCSFLNIFFVFSRETRHAPNIGKIIKILKSEYPNHELTKLFLKAYSKNPQTWMFTLRVLRNNLHHESAYIGEIDVIDLPIHKISFFIYEEYFNNSVSKEKREIKYFCRDVLGRTEQFLSRMYGILFRELETKNCIPFYDLKRFNNISF